MSVHINEVLDYLDAHPIGCQEGDVDSLLEMIHDAYYEHNHLDSEEIKRNFRRFRSLLKEIPHDKTDELFAVVCDLCIEHEVLAFSHGILVGMHFMTEVNMLP